MDELDKQIANAFTWELINGTITGELKTHVDVELVKQAFKDAGYIHLPNSQGKSITIYTSDNPEPLMTEAEWYEKYLKEHQGQDKQADA